MGARLEKFAVLHDGNPVTLLNSTETMRTTESKSERTCILINYGALHRFGSEELVQTERPQFPGDHELDESRRLQASYTNDVKIVSH